MFRDGDIVEIAFSFVGVRIRDSRMMIYLSLRALNLIDDSVRKVRQLIFPLWLGAE